MTDCHNEWFSTISPPAPSFVVWFIDIQKFIWSKLLGYVTYYDVKLCQMSSKTYHSVARNVDYKVIPSLVLSRTPHHSHTSNRLPLLPGLFLVLVGTRKFVYYESRKRELKIRLMNEGRSDERLKDRVEESTWLTYTGLHDKTNQKYLEIKMRSSRNPRQDTADHCLMSRRRRYTEEVVIVTVLLRELHSWN